VEGVIALPAQLFPGTPIPACVLLLRYPTGRREDVLFIDARARGRRSGAVRVLEERDLADIEEVLAAHREPMSAHPAVEGFATVCDPTREPGQGCSLYPPEHVNQRAGTRDGKDVAHREFTARELVNEAWYRVRDAANLVEGIEVDAFPSAERHLPLNALCTVQPGPSHSRLKDKVSACGEVPVVLPKHVRGHRILPSTDCVTREVADDLARFRLVPGDIVCVRSGAAGQVARVGEAQAGWLSSTNLLRLHDFRLDQVEPDFLLAYLSRPDVQKWITDRAEATVIPFINTATLGQLSVALPSLSEQRRMAAALRAVDERITAHRDLVDTLDAHRTALVELLLPELTFSS
jgi:type I restriction enzyme M protein